SMPLPIRVLTQVLPPRYFVASLQTLFLAGDVPAVLVPNTLVLLGFAAVLGGMLVRSTPTRLEGGGAEKGDLTGVEFRGPRGESVLVFSPKGWEFLAQGNALGTGQQPVVFSLKG